MSTSVFFCTNRVASGELTDPASYSADLQKANDPTDLIYGTAYVDGTDLVDNTSWTIRSLQDISRGDFADDVRGDIAQSGRNLLVFLHGFDNTFGDAITRAAFNRAWMAASRIGTADTSVLAFSWPSAGRILGVPIPWSVYQRDQNSARLSGYHVMTFLSRLEPLLKAARRNSRRAYLLAHSMGNLALEAAVEAWFVNGNGRDTLFDAAFLAAGDCGADVFAQPDPARLRGLTDLSSRVHILYSSSDKVLQLSQEVNLGAQRIGQDGPLHRTDLNEFPAAQFTMWDASRLNDYADGFMSSHQYYRMSPTARHWIIEGMDGSSEDAVGARQAVS